MTPYRDRLNAGEYLPKPEKTPKAEAKPATEKATTTPK